MSFGPPVFDFDRLKPVTMTVIVSYDVQELNLPALFMFLPVTDQVLPPHLSVQKKQGKIRLPPELNRPGEILSMRYNKQVRGIIRSENAKSFPHLIIVDIGTSERIISVKLSKTLELTGPTSVALAREAAEALLNLCRTCHDNILFIREHKEAALVLRDRYLEAYIGALQTNVPIGSTKIPTDAVDARLWQIFIQQTRGYGMETVGQFLDFLINFDRNLIAGSLKLGNFECEMVNILFNLGYSINQVPFSQLMNGVPFRSIYNNYKSASAVIVYYDYMKRDRNTGQPKQAKHTIRVNRSGHVRHSGPNLETMKAVYYAFMQRTLAHCLEVQSVETARQYLRLVTPPKVYSVDQWQQLIQNGIDLHRRIANNEVPIARGEIPPPVEEKTITLEIIDAGQRELVAEQRNDEAPVMTFNYSAMFNY